MWGADNPSFVKQFFGFVSSHSRVRMIIYNQGQNPSGPFRLVHYPRSAARIRQELANPRYPGFA
jgi:hypothetical protein